MFGLSTLGLILAGVACMLMFISLFIGRSSREGQVVTFVVGLIVAGIFAANNTAIIGISFLHIVALYSGVGFLLYVGALILGLFVTYGTFSKIRSEVDEAFSTMRSDFVVMANSLIKDGKLDDKSIDKLIDKVNDFVGRKLSDNELSSFLVESDGGRMSRRQIVSYIITARIESMEKSGQVLTGDALASIFTYIFFNVVRTQALADKSRAYFNPMRLVLAFGRVTRTKDDFVIKHGDNFNHYFVPTVSLSTDKSELAEMAGVFIFMWPLEMINFLLSGVINQIANLTARLIRGTLGRILISPLK